ncbi:MAG: hypothetical protein JWN72_599 [Thermoleophilia bacterium]|nr:hypothetical protein [Thermoleophilia bacterium]
MTAAPSSAMSGCSLPPATLSGATGGGAPGKEVAQTTPVQGGGGLASVSALSPVLTQLTEVIRSLSTVVGSQVGGASGGGAAAAPAAAAQPAAPTGATPPATTTPVTAPAPVTPAPAPAAATTAAPATNAAAGAAAVQGGGATTDNAALITALQGVIQAITSLVTLLQAQAAATTGGGAPGKTPVQSTPATSPPATQVAGASGAGTAPQKVEQAVTPAPAKVVATPVVAAPPVAAPPAVPAVPTAVAGANGGPAQTPGQSPTQSPVQSPVQAPTQVGGVVGGGALDTVTLSDDDARSAGTLTASNGDSVSIWGDPHVTLNLGGVEEKFEIGYGPGSVTLGDGTKVEWGTFGDATGDRYKHLQYLRVDSPGTTGDVGIDTGDQQAAKDIKTSLTAAQLKELAAALRTYKGDWQQPLKQVAA